MTDKERAEMQNLRRRVVSQREEIKALQGKIAARHGRWIYHSADGVYGCSVCGTNQYGAFSEIYTGLYKYCPICGAIMDGEQLTPAGVVRKGGSE